MLGRQTHDKNEMQAQHQKLNQAFAMIVVNPGTMGVRVFRTFVIFQQMETIEYQREKLEKTRVRGKAWKLACLAPKSIGVSNFSKIINATLSG